MSCCARTCVVQRQPRKGVLRGSHRCNMTYRCCTSCTSCTSEMYLPWRANRLSVRGGVQLRSCLRPSIMDSLSAPYKYIYILYILYIFYIYTLSMWRWCRFATACVVQLLVWCRTPQRRLRLAADALIVNFFFRAKGWMVALRSLAVQDTYSVDIYFGE